MSFCHPFIQFELISSCKTLPRPSFRHVVLFDPSFTFSVPPTITITLPHPSLTVSFFLYDPFRKWKYQGFFHFISFKVPRNTQFERKEKNNNSQRLRCFFFLQSYISTSPGGISRRQIMFALPRVPLENSSPYQLDKTGVSSWKILSLLQVRTQTPEKPYSLFLPFPNVTGFLGQGEFHLVVKMILPLLLHTFRFCCYV